MRFIACGGIHNGMLFVCVVAPEIPVWLREYVESSRPTVPLSSGRDAVRWLRCTHSHSCACDTRRIPRHAIQT